DASTSLFYITGTSSRNPIGTIIPGNTTHPILSSWSSLTDGDNGLAISSVVDYAIPLGAFNDSSTTYPFVLVPHPGGGFIIHSIARFLSGGDYPKFIEDVISFLANLSVSNGIGQIQSGTYIADGVI